MKRLFCAATLLLFGIGCSLLLDTLPLKDGKCDEDHKACGQLCVSLDDPTLGCALEACSPCLLSNATPVCGDDGTCEIGSCHSGYRNCNADNDDGCEVDLMHDPDHCGDCTLPCPALPHAEPGCTRGSCVIGRCKPGYRDCNGVAADGCEVDLQSDPESCGACDSACKSHLCNQGVCEAP